MKYKVFNFFALALAALCVEDSRMQGGGGQTTGTSAQKGIVGDPLPYGERAKTVFNKIREWTPGEFRNAVPIDEARRLLTPEGNTLLHAAIDAENVPVAELLTKEYGFVGNLPNRQGQTAIALAEHKGIEQFAGVFSDMKPTEPAI